MEVVRQKMSGLQSDNMNISEEEFRYSEYKALSERSDDAESEFVTVPQDIASYEPFLQSFLDKVVLVEKLAETRALTGFSRINPPPYREFSHDDQLQLSLKWRPWLPAIRVYGEGIFFRIKDSAVKHWSTPDVVARYEGIMATHRRIYVQLGRTPRDFTTRFFMLHTLAHILIRRLSYDCGYGSSSLRERLYCWDEPGKEMTGILIYYGQPAILKEQWADLSNKGNPVAWNRSFGGRFTMRVGAHQIRCVLKATVRVSTRLTVPHAMRVLCFLKLVVKKGIVFLDRAALIGTTDHPEIGFFSDVIESVLT